MGTSAPYIQRRGYGLTFRIAVPVDLRQQIGVCEITKALPTSNRQEAIHLALSLAHQAKKLFFKLRTVKNKAHASPDDSLEIGFSLELDLDEFGFAKRVKVQAEAHEEAAVSAALRTVLENRANRPNPNPTATPNQLGISQVANETRSPLLSEVIDDFLLS